METSETRLCRHCNTTKPITDFYPSVAYKCKRCILDYEKQWNKLNPEKAKAKWKSKHTKYRDWYLEYGRKYEANRRPERTLSQKQRESAQLWKDRNRIAVNATQRIYTEIKAGRMIRPEVCSECGVKCKPVGHHDDYSKPLDVRWVCVSCHRNIHYFLNLKLQPQV